MSRRRVVTGLVGLFVAVLAGFVLWRTLGPVASYPAGSQIRFDDFDFTALTARETAPGTYLVRVRVTNSAKRVDFEFDPSVVLASDSGGVDLDQHSLPDSALLAAGESTERDLTFFGATGLQDVHIRFAFGGRIGELLDDVLLGKREVVVSTS